jgi:hypothetical protein
MVVCLREMVVCLREMVACLLERDGCLLERDGCLIMYQPKSTSFRLPANRSLVGILHEKGLRHGAVSYNSHHFFF